MRAFPNDTAEQQAIALSEQVARHRAELERARAEIYSNDKERLQLQKELETAKAQLEQERVQHAGCLTAAEGWTKDPAIKGQYGWSLAYQKTLELRLAYEAAKAKLESDELHRWVAMCEESRLGIVLPLPPLVQKFQDALDKAEAENARLAAALEFRKGLIRAAVCPECDDSGAKYMPDGDVAQCKWCADQLLVLQDKDSSTALRDLLGPIVEALESGEQLLRTCDSYYRKAEAPSPLIAFGEVYERIVNALAHLRAVMGEKT